MIQGTVLTNHCQIVRADFVSLDSRLKTFEKWPRKSPAPNDLARCGFYYLQEEDKTRCFYCGIIVYQWLNEDNPWIEHAIYSNKCPHLLVHRSRPTETKDTFQLAIVSFTSLFILMLNLIFIFLKIFLWIFTGGERIFGKRNTTEGR